MGDGMSCGGSNLSLLCTSNWWPTGGGYKARVNLIGDLGPTISGILHLFKEVVHAQPCPSQ